MSSRIAERPKDVSRAFSERVLVGWLGQKEWRPLEEQQMLHDFMLATRHLGRQTEDRQDEHSVSRGWHLDVRGTDGARYGLTLHFVGLAERDPHIGAYDSGTFHFRLHKEGTGYLITAALNRNHNVDADHAESGMNTLSVLQEIEDLRPAHAAIKAQQDRIGQLHKQRLAQLKK